MRIDGDAWFPKGIAEHDIRRFPSHTGQSHELFQGLRHLAPVVRAQRAGQANARFGLGPIEAQGMKDVLQFLTIGSGQSLGPGISLEKTRRDRVDPGIGGLRGQDRRDQ